jgi:RNA polymerase sigma-70 factor (ECF subfamily)
MRAFTACAPELYVLRALEGRPKAWYDSCVAESHGRAADESANPAAPESRISDDMELAAALPAPLPTLERPVLRAAEEPSDADLLLRVARSDRAAFEVLYARYARAVLSLALRLLRDRGRAEDATQETFTAVWRSAKSYKPERGPGAPWLFAVARNAIVDRARARTDIPVEHGEETASGYAGPEEVAEQAWLQWRVHRAMVELPARERIALELAYWSGLSQSEIAERLGVPLGTVKTRTRAALARLAQMLEGEEL